VGVIGTGPFKFQSWSTGDQIALARHDDYWDKANGGPYLDTVSFKILTEATTRVAGLGTGELSAILASIPGDQLPIVQGMPDVTLQMTDTYLTDFIAFNTQVAPFDNAALRQALNYAVDKVAVRQVSLGDFALDARATQIGPAMWVFDKELWEAAYPQVPDYAYDMDMARQLLEQSGVADQLDGKVITTDENPVRLAQALALQAAAAELGHDLEIERITFTELISRSFGGARDYDVITNWGSDFPDPAGNLLPNYASSNTGEGGSNFANYVNPRIDELLNGQHAELDRTKRTEMMIEAQGIIAADSPMIYFDHPRHPWALNKAFTGYDIPPLWYWDSFVKDIHLAQ
jgi:peptide/nickel transport system substrate-binding protein